MVVIVSLQRLWKQLTMCLLNSAINDTTLSNSGDKTLLYKSYTLDFKQLIDIPVIFRLKSHKMCESALCFKKFISVTAEKL